MNVLDVDSLSIEFSVSGGSVRAADKVSFAVPEGRTVALVGESGSGKSAIAQAIMGLLPDNGRVSGGAIGFRDPADGKITDLAKLKPTGREFRTIRGRRIGLIFQEPLSAFSPVHTVGDQIADTLRAHDNANEASAKRTVAHLLKLVGFPEPQRAVEAYPFELSGGLRQRAMIASALVARPALVIADEPTTALDVTIQAQVLKLLADLQHELGLSLLLITHDLGVVASIADEIVVLYRGQVMESGPSADVFAHARHPYFKALSNAVPRLDGETRTRLATLAPETPRSVQPRATRLSADGPPLIELKRVSKKFSTRRGDGETLAVADVDLTVAPGECVGLVGESGSGKSTVAKLILRALKPDAGEVLFRDGDTQRDLARFGTSEMKRYRRRVQYVFQDPFAALDPRLTVLETVREPLIVHGIGNRTSQIERVKELLSLVGLDPRALNRYPHSFSGGQRQRIGIARALALEPDLLICDEPTSALDVSVQAQILNLLKDLQRDLGLTYLFISHNLAVVDFLADRVAVMCRGRLVEIAPPKTLFRSPRHPYTRALIAAVPEPDPSHKLDLALLMDGRASDPAQWPSPFTLGGTAQSRFVDVTDGHRVLVSAELAPTL